MLPAGYSGVSNVFHEELPPDNTQQTWFLAETLKYLYLTFQPREALRLDEWVLSTEAHPFRVQGS